MTEWAPVSVIPAVQLFLAAMYASHPPASDFGLKPAPITGRTDIELINMLDMVACPNFDTRVCTLNSVQYML